MFLKFFEKWCEVKKMNKKIRLFIVAGLLLFVGGSAYSKSSAQNAFDNLDKEESSANVPKKEQAKKTVKNEEKINDTTKAEKSNNAAKGKANPLVVPNNSVTAEQKSIYIVHDSVVSVLDYNSF